jgi:hypothetical protein
MADMDARHKANRQKQAEYDNAFSGCDHLKVFVCVDHDRHYPVGAASIVIAETIEQAQQLLDEKLKEQGLKPHENEPYTLKELSLETSYAEILVNGDY